MNSKNFLTSLTFWGGFLAVAAAAAGFFGFDPAKLPSADEIVGIIGGILAIIGRFKATTTLTLM